jgi:hypothetical protein
MNYTQEQLDAALRYANARAAQPNEVAILAAEVRRLQATLGGAENKIDDEWLLVVQVKHLSETLDQADASIIKLRADLAARDEIIKNMERGARQGAVECREYIARLEKDAAQLREGVAARDATIAKLVAAGDYMADWFSEDSQRPSEVAALKDWQAAKSAAPISSFTCTIEGFDMSTRTLQIQLPCALSAWHIGKQVTLSA